MGALAGATMGGCPADEAGGLSQVDATPTLPGLCPPTVEVCADEGASACAEGGIRTCIETSGCLHWGVVVACAPGALCAEDAGSATCESSCSGAACTVPESRRCAPDEAASFQRCVDDGAGCLVWSAPTACAGGETCGQGGLCAATCADECAAGSKRCEGASVVTCDDHDDDACLEWGGATACTGACAIGACVDACQDECASVGLRRCDGASVQVCVEGIQGCRVWTAAESCAPGTTCSAGLCAADCVDECDVGATACDAGGVVVCTERDSDACRDRSLPSACPDGEACSDGACLPIASCVDECTSDDERRCDSSGLIVEACGQWDADACREWARVDQCDLGQTCSLGRCVDGCEDECEGDARRCRPGSTTAVEVCKVDGDGDACREWAAASDCADDGKVCAQGECAASCVDECAADACVGDTIAPCGDFDADDCKDLGTPIACLASEQCSAAAAVACVARPAPGDLKISEVLYNTPGDDDDTFIELAGQPGTSLSGFFLDATNGADGVVYATLALGGVVPGDGFFVIVHPAANGDLLAVADKHDPFADLQNGPDNLILRWGDDVVVDALGYGDFKAGDTFMGEGRPAVGPQPGQALARIGALQDTGDNLDDFAVVPGPTAGGPFVSARRPSALGDLVVSELMVDPKALTDATGEWIELVNPHATTTWDLSGCKLTSESNESHTFQGLLVPPLGRVVLARSANAVAGPDYIYGGITLANDIDLVALSCDEVLIDDFAWLETAPTGKSISVDPFFEDAELNDFEGAWCPAPVEPADGADAGTPGEKNPPCPNQSGTYDETVLDSTWGACDPTPNWQSFVFEGAPAALEDATLSFEWWTVLCPLFAERSEIWIELEAGGQWVEVAHATLTNGLDACEWLAAGTTVGKSTINAARATSGMVQGRFRIEGGCPSGVGCGVLGLFVPNNCARDMSLSYPY